MEEARHHKAKNLGEIGDALSNTACSAVTPTSSARALANIVLDQQEVTLPQCGRPFMEASSSATCFTGLHH
jgi:hypothetical protein